jgi:hypothetical protein
MRSSKFIPMAAAVAIFCCAAVVSAQQPQQQPPPQKPPEKSTTNPTPSSTSAKDIVVVDVSNQLSQLKDQKVGADKKVTAVPINLSQASGYKQGLDLVAFRLAGTIDRADGKSASGEDPTAGGTDKSAGGSTDKGTGTVILQAIVSPRSDLTYEDVMRIANRGPDAKSPSDLRDSPPKGGANPSADTAGAAVLCECRTSSLTSGGKGRTFEIVGFAPAEGGRVTPELMGDIKRRLTETTAAAAKNDPANPGAAVGSMAAEPKPQDVKQALDCIEKGKAFLYLNFVPEMAMPGKAEHDATGSAGAGACALKEITLTFAGVSKSAP